MSLKMVKKLALKRKETKKYLCAKKGEPIGSPFFCYYQCDTYLISIIRCAFFISVSESLGR